jgi:feruloyl esterase
MERGTVFLKLGGLMLACGIFVSGPVLASEQACSNLKNASFKDTTIESTEEIRPDPAWEFPPSVFNGLAATDPTGTLNAKEPFCRVVAAIEGDIGFELWLPENWNGKYQQVGNGAYTGAINYPTMGGALAKGYATSSTDLGHVSKNSFATDWMVGNKQAIENFGHRAHHVVSEISKQMVDAYYGEAPNYSYFVGCSSGGWQALTEIQQYPDDFDGVVAGAPAHNFVRMNLRGTVTAQMSLANPEGDLNRAQTRLVADAALKTCDAKDGLADSLISDPLHCSFDPAQLQCAANEPSDSCLTPAQVERVEALYGPIKSRGGLDLYPGPTISAALSPGRPANADAPALAGPLGDALEAFGYTKALTIGNFDADRDIPPMEEIMNPVMTAMDPDLSAFEARGGKVLAWQGWGDPAISPYNTIEYYDSVRQATGANMDDFYRIFFVPGMGHCGAGATGPDKFDAVAALEDWVEKDTAPSRIEATQYADGQVERTMPLCKYPEVPEYKGSGDPNQAQSFACMEP